uniref:ISXO2-like transposase domain-containing protein n=1 Tax=Romanomermis culicivorax TaxID=13658 RepID=A0A915KUG8_ROMCU
MLANILNNVPLMGGPNEIVEIEESYFRGRRKPAGNGAGRMFLGNLVGPARRNYGAVVDGPWIFGLVQKRQDNKLDHRFFQVMGHDANTLNLIIQRNVAPGTMIRSDKWAAYNGLGALNYIHKMVNHSLFFVDPVTRINTQQIETSWGAAKMIIMWKMGGTSHNLLLGHMAEFWWRGLNKDNAFNVILNELPQNYPI